VGGVWFHNAYPGARVDVESRFYCYYFDPELYKEWRWSERYATQGALLAYLNHVADRYDLRRHYLFNTWMTEGVWDPAKNRYIVTTDTGRTFTARFLVMATGQLSKPRRPPFAGLGEFTGEWAQTSRWRPVSTKDRRVAVIGTGSSGVQSVTAISREAAHTYVFQRTAHYCVPANNGPADETLHDEIAGDVDAAWRRLLETPGGAEYPPTPGKAGDFTAAEQRRILEERWAYGGPALLCSFEDMETDPEVNRLVADFVRDKTRKRIDDPVLQDKLVCDSYPIGGRRVCFDTGYYECFNQGNVSLVDIDDDPIERLTATGIRLASGAHIELDTIVFAIGFESFTAALFAADISDERGRGLGDSWAAGPRTFLGITTTGFPNLFIITGPQSPGVLTANLNLAGVQQVDFIGDLIAYMARRRYQRVEPARGAADAWTRQTKAAGERSLRRRFDDYLVHVNERDGARTLIPYAGGMREYVRHCDQVVASGYAGFRFQ
jgi:cation diffusion facilitator CzcD-associated flavoprotein CzcO